MARIQTQPADGSATHNIDFNSVRLAPTGIACPNTALEVATTSGPVINVRNNILANFTAAQAARAKHYAWVTSSATLTGAVGSVSDHNLFFINNTTNGFVGRGNATDDASLANWQSAVGQDAHSKSSNPQFMSATDLHIGAAPTDVEAGASFYNGAISWAALDIDGQTRNTTAPDIGFGRTSGAGTTPGFRQSFPAVSGRAAQACRYSTIEKEYQAPLLPRRVVPREAAFTISRLTTRKLLAAVWRSATRFNTTLRRRTRQ